jgi:NitT/TauT family transport system permease protein
MASPLAVSESRKEAILAIALPALTGLAILTLWQLATRSGDIPEVFLPSPAAVFSELQRSAGELWHHGGITAVETIVSFLVAILVGSSLAVLISFSMLFRETVFPAILTLQMVPKIALAPLFVILFGIGIASKVVLVAVTVFFLVLTATLDGVRNVDRDLVRALSIMGATRSEVIRKVLVPGALPWIFTGMRIAVRYAFSNTLLAELIASNRGIGFLIEYYSGTFDSAGAYAAILVLVACSVGLTELLSRIEARMGRR